MDEDILTYTFDFEKEVNALRAKLGEWAENILFVRVNVQHANSPRELPRVSVKEIIGDGQLISKYLHSLCHVIENNYSRIPEDNSYAAYLKNRDGSHGADFVAFRENSSYSLLFGDGPKHCMSLFELCHETFHALANDQNTPDEDHPIKECSADAFAALCLLQRFGAEAKNLVSMFSWVRASNAVLHDTTHLTTTVLDRIIADSASQNFFSDMTSEETIELAEHYAAEWTPEASVLSAARSSFRQEGPGLNVNRLFKIGVNSPVNSLDLYVSSKVLQLFLAPEEIRWNGEIFNWDEESKSIVSAAIEERMANWSLSETFNNKAALRTGAGPSLTTALPVSPPKGQKIFTVKTDFT